MNGDKISFKVSFNGMTITHEGTVNGDEIKLTSKSDQGDFPGGEMTLKRVQSNAASRQLGHRPIPPLRPQCEASRSHRFSALGRRPADLSGQGICLPISSSTRPQTDGSFSISMCGFMKARANLG